MSIQDDTILGSLDIPLNADRIGKEFSRITEGGMDRSRTRGSFDIRTIVNISEYHLVADVVLVDRAMSDTNNLEIVSDGGKVSDTEINRGITA
jgi:hypothetical protein